MKPTFNQIVAATMGFLFFIGLVLILFIPTKGNPSYGNGIILAFSSSMTACLGYLIGSSSGSQKKDDLLATSTQNKTA